MKLAYANLLLTVLSALSAVAMELKVESGGTVERQGDGTWLCRIDPGRGFAWLEFTGLPPDFARATGVEFDFYVPDLSFFGGVFAFLCSPDGGSTRWRNAMPLREGVWSTITLPADDPTVVAFLPDNSDYCEKKADWARADRFRLMFIRERSTACEVRVGNVRPVLPAAARPPAPDERRLAWARQTALSERYDWEETAEFLATNRFTDLLAVVVRGGSAFYDSKYLPRGTKVGPERDSVKEAIAACHRRGLKFHAWKVCFNADHPDTPKDWVERMRAEKRFQVNFRGVERAWLCPADPRNRALEVAVMKELAALGPDGIHFDYVRYEDGNTCFCERCLRRLSEKTGRTVRSADEVKADAALSAEWQRLRCEDITSVVREVADYVHAHHPGVEVSAAVLSGFAQDGGDAAQMSAQWAREGLLDFVCPMDYRMSSDAFRHIVDDQIAALRGTRTKLYPGIAIGCSNYPKLPEECFLRELDSVRARGLGGFTLFALDPYAEELVPKMASEKVW